MSNKEAVLRQEEILVKLAAVAGVKPTAFLNKRNKPPRTPRATNKLSSHLNTTTKLNSSSNNSNNNNNNSSLITRRANHNNGPLLLAQRLNKAKTHHQVGRLLNTFNNNRFNNNRFNNRHLELCLLGHQKFSCALMVATRFLTCV